MTNLFLSELCTKVAHIFDSLSYKLEGTHILICGFCYRSIEDHKEYPTQYCYSATQCRIALSQYEKNSSNEWYRIEK